jgi:hypothetical protein
LKDVLTGRSLLLGMDPKAGRKDGGPRRYYEVFQSCSCRMTGVVVEHGACGVLVDYTNLEAKSALMFLRK